MIALRAFALAAMVAFAGTALADQNDPRLDGLFAQLKASTSTAETQTIEADIWSIWLETPDEAIRALMDEGSLAITHGDFALALRAFDEVVARAPDYAEGWNKRATVHYLLDHLQESLDDVDATLKLEPRHFGALAGRGLVYIKMRDLRRALTAVEEALDVNPQMPGPRSNAEALRQALGVRDI